MTHSDLVHIACRWLSRSCSVVVSEIKGTREIPDAIGWHGAATILVECKTSKADFYRDSKKRFRLYGGVGLSRYYLTPPGLLKEFEIPEKWGWLETDGTMVSVRKKSEPFPDRNVNAETRMLVSACRRINQKSTIYAKIYTHFVKRAPTIHLGEEPIINALKSYMSAYYRAVDPGNADVMIQSELERFERYLTTTDLRGYTGSEEENLDS